MTNQVNLNEPVGQMECCNGYRYRSTGGGRSPEPVVWSILPVHLSPMAFDLLAALAQVGLLEGQLGTPLSEQAEENWGGSVEAFLNDLEKRGITRQSVVSRSLEKKRVMIGWAYEKVQKGNAYKISLCCDIELTLAVLSRCVNQIFFENREPDFTWSALFGQTLVVDEDLRALVSV